VSVLPAVLLPTVPAAAGLAGLLVPRGNRRVAGTLGVAATGLALLAAIALAVRPDTGASVRLADLGDITVHAGVRTDAVAAAVAVAVGAVALLVQVYSLAYLRGDERYAPYAAQVSLFTAAMLDVVVAADLVQMLVGWEVMGICSYLLIGHDRRLPEAPGAAVKAFLVTRVGDIGFWLAVVLLGTGAGSFRLDDVLVAAGRGELSPGRITIACLLLLAGVAGKSAQFPLHTWLPDAMAGPTPVSALIHAATMVAAGVYVVQRLDLLFVLSPVALAVLAVLASVSALGAALAATAQDDIKRVLAYSTISQVAYMAGGLAVADGGAAIFHLLTHAAFKALLFLAAGSVIHAVGSNSMGAMGGLRRGMPVTFWTMTVGLAALAGVPPFAGFWSKESVLGAAAGATTGTGPTPHWAAWLVLVAGLATVAVTGWYATRLWLRTFFGAQRSPFTPHEPPRLMWVPLVVLAVPSALLGLLALVPGKPTRYGWFVYGQVHQVNYLPGTGFGGAGLDPVTLAVGLLLTAAGILAGYLVWRRDPAADPARVLGRARPVLAAAFGADAAQRALVVRPVLWLAAAVRRGDEQLVDGAVEATGTGALGLGRLLARLHTGLPRYLAAVLTGAALLGVLAVIVGGVR
jgi:NADH-quinone oxidoreductase subunit L